VRQDAVIAQPILGLVTHSGTQQIGIVTTIKDGALRYSAIGASTTEVPIDVGRTPYRIAITHHAPAVARSGQPFEMRVQLVAKLDQAFGWYQQDRGLVSVAFFRRRFAYNTLAPFLASNKTAALDLDGVAIFTDLEVSEISGNLAMPEREFFFTFSVELIIDGFLVDISSINSPSFLAEPGPATKIVLNTPLSSSADSLLPLPVSPVLYVSDKVPLCACAHKAHTQYIYIYINLFIYIYIYIYIHIYIYI